MVEAIEKRNSSAFTQGFIDAQDAYFNGLIFDEGLLYGEKFAPIWTEYLVWLEGYEKGWNAASRHYS